MKRYLAFLLMLSMVLPAAALAETDSPAPYALSDGVAVELDIDGDGTAEMLTFHNAVDTQSNGEYTEIKVDTSDGASIVWHSETLFLSQAYACDLDGDGIVEIFVCGDWASDDYATYCLHYADGAFETLSFANASRFDEDNAYIDYGYGYIQSIGDNELVLNGSQDVLGTYFGTRTFALENGVFEFADDGLWHFPIDDFSWERALTPTQDIAATFIDGNGQSEGAIGAGTRFVITASDKVSIAYFETEDGRAGTLSIAPDVQNGWGFTVNGIPESELFEMVPYAD